MDITIIRTKFHHLLMNITGFMAIWEIFILGRGPIFIPKKARTSIYVISKRTQVPNLGPSTKKRCILQLNHSLSPFPTQIFKIFYWSLNRVKSFPPKCGQISPTIFERVPVYLLGGYPHS